MEYRIKKKFEIIEENKDNDNKISETSQKKQIYKIKDMSKNFFYTEEKKNNFVNREDNMVSINSENLNNSEIIFENLSSKLFLKNSLNKEFILNNEIKNIKKNDQLQINNFQTILSPKKNIKVENIKKKKKYSFLYNIKNKISIQNFKNSTVNITKKNSTKIKKKNFQICFDFQILKNEKKRIAPSKPNRCHPFRNFMCKKLKFHKIKFFPGIITFHSKEENDKKDFFSNEPLKGIEQKKIIIKYREEGKEYAEIILKEKMKKYEIDKKEYDEYLVKYNENLKKEKIRKKILKKNYEKKKKFMQREKKKREKTLEKDSKKKKKLLKKKIAKKKKILLKK